MVPVRARAVVVILEALGEHPSAAILGEQRAACGLEQRAQSRQVVANAAHRENQEKKLESATGSRSSTRVGTKIKAPGVQAVEVMAYCSFRLFLLEANTFMYTTTGPLAKTPLAPTDALAAGSM